MVEQVWVVEVLVKSHVKAIPDWNTYSVFKTRKQARSYKALNKMAWRSNEYQTVSVNLHKGWREDKLSLFVLRNKVFY